MRRDNIAALTSDYRIWELGDRVSYALLYLAKSVDVEGPPRPTLGGERPTVSVSRSAFEDVLERVVALARRSGAQPILLTTGDDPEDTAVAHRGLAYLDRGDPVAAAAEFELLVRTNPDQFLGWFLLDRARVALGEDPSALRARYAESLAGLAYIDTFAWYADEYLPVLRAVAEREGVPLVDLRETFRRENVRFFDVCHFGPKGHRLIARALADVIAARLDRREGRGGADAATDSTG